MEFLVALIIIGLFVYFMVKLNSFFPRELSPIETENLRKSILKKSRKIIHKHRKQLGIQRQKAIFTDDYGKEFLNNWYEKEIPHFIRHHITPELDELEKINSFIVDLAKEIDKQAIKEEPKDLEFNKSMNGYDFEIFCLKRLKKDGWNVQKTKKGADQGVDLIISKGRRKIAVQCKKYSRPIGNKAVQEVKAGIKHYSLGEGIVITNNSFTKSAIELAKSNNIKLLHYLEIENI